VGGQEFAAGQCISDRYELEERLGRGGMGEVWRARHLALKSHVAIKFLHAASAQEEKAQKRFVTEAQLTAQIKTRHAVQVFDFGVTDGGQPFIVMELLDGETVGHRLERAGRLPRAATVRFLQQAARALDRAHALGIVHRDFKPDNLVIVKDEDGRETIKVLDFGIAKLVGDLEVASGPRSSSRGVPDDTLVDGDEPMSLTATNAVLGTPHYMAPEQIRRDEMGPAIDIWAFGVVAFECLTGVPPFDGTTLIDIFTRIQVGRHLSVRELAPDLPAEFDDWFAMACALDPAARFRSATVAARALAVSLESARWEKDHRPSPLLGVSVTSLEPGEGSSPISLPSGTLATGARLLARRPRELSDTHAPASRPAAAAAPTPHEGPPSPVPSVSSVPSAPPTSRSQLATVRSRRPRSPWLLATVAASALVLASWVLAWRGLSASRGGPTQASGPAVEVMGAAALSGEVPAVAPPGAASTGTADASDGDAAR
jgi:serine/threonine-protein kinase